MRAVVAVLLCAALPALAQAPASTPAPKSAPCADCGVVTSVRTIQKNAPTVTADTKPSGLVATVPFGGGKPQIGSSTKLGREATTGTTTWEVIVRMNDGRYRVLSLGEEPEVRQGDKVRIDEGRVVLRND